VVTSRIFGEVAAGVFAALVVVAAAMPATANAARRGSEFLSAFKPGPAPAGFAHICSRYAWACSNRGGKGGGDYVDLARSINAAVNNEIRPATDQELYGRREYWTLPKDAGDCEDYALLKMKRLIQAGVPPANLFLATVVLSANEVHVVLVVRSRSGDFVLDNLSSTVSPWRATRYTFIKMQSASDRSHWDIVLLGRRATRE
jgi:predicted transglutaminase-like cysteine proteinase